MSVRSRDQRIPEQLQAATLAARRLTVLRAVLADEVALAFLALLETLADTAPSTPSDAPRVLGAYGRAFEQLASSYVTSRATTRLVGDAWQSHLLRRLLEGVGPFAERAARGDPLGDSLRAAARHDLRLLQALFELDAETMRRAVVEYLATANGRVGPVETVAWLDLGGRDEADGELVVLARRFAATADWGELVDTLAAHYAARGIGALARYLAFRWDRASGRLEGIAEPDPTRLEQLIGYERERARLVRNTEHFLAGYPANNVLLYGDRGTGKSSSVKALLHEFAGRGLRLVEIHKDELGDLPLLLRHLRDRPQRFVVFIDDLSFDEGETSYKNLKALLEGSLEARPANVLLYATSNRRHLVQERFSDRANPASDEVHAQDTMQEKLSLSDRFGITIIFPSPDQEQYLQIVAGLAAQRRLPIAPPELRQRALQWALMQNGRSGRTARQFVDYLTAELGLDG